MINYQLFNEFLKDAHKFHYTQCPFCFTYYEEHENFLNFYKCDECSIDVGGILYFRYNSRPSYIVEEPYSLLYNRLDYNVVIEKNGIIISFYDPQNHERYDKSEKLYYSSNFVCLKHKVKDFSGFKILDVLEDKEYCLDELNDTYEDCVTKLLFE